MNRPKKMTPELLAQELSIDVDKFLRLLVAIGFAEVGNEAYRKAILDDCEIPTDEHYSMSINLFLDEAEKQGYRFNL